MADRDTYEWAHRRVDLARHTERRKAIGFARLTEAAKAAREVQLTGQFEGDIQFVRTSGGYSAVKNGQEQALLRNGDDNPVGFSGLSIWNGHANNVTVEPVSASELQRFETQTGDNISYWYPPNPFDTRVRRFLCYKLHKSKPIPDKVGIRWNDVPRVNDTVYHGVIYPTEQIALMNVKLTGAADRSGQKHQGEGYMTTAPDISKCEWELCCSLLLLRPNLYELMKAGGEPPEDNRKRDPETDVVLRALNKLKNCGFCDDAFAAHSVICAISDIASDLTVQVLCDELHTPYLRTIRLSLDIYSEVCDPNKEASSLLCARAKVHESVEQKSTLSKEELVELFAQMLSLSKKPVKYEKLMLKSELSFEPVSVLPGIGDQYASALKQSGYDTVGKVLAEFLKVGKDCDLFSSWLKRTANVKEHHCESCYDCLMEWSRIHML